LTGIVATTGPITAPIFLAYGLVKGAFIATEAAGSLAVYLSKAAVFRRFGALPLDVITQGLITGASLMAGAWIAKRFVLRLHPDRFRLLMDALMLISGLSMLWTAFR
ncbi:MAG: TSUP family transporter, partial [Candidatus Rokuibacteriota bacterium]